MKLSTEYRIGVLSFACSILASTMMLFTILFGVTVSGFNAHIVLCLFAIHLASLIVLFHFWVDKFNYIED